MSQSPAHHLHADAVREKRAVALSSLGAAVVLTGVKLLVGWWTNSLGILAEAAHSGLDLVAAAVTFWAVRVAGRPADHDHTYGHGKFENLSALVETILLLLTCVWIIYEATDRLFFQGSAEVDVNFWAFAVVLGSIVIDYSRSRALLRAAHKYQSQALEADALHFSTDIWSSLVVFFGLIAVWAAEQFRMPWLIRADSIAALGVALIVIHVSWQLGKKSVSDLLDAVPAALPEQVASAAAQVPGVQQVKQVRVRRSGAEVFTDVTLTVDRAAPLEGAHEIADQAESAVRSVLPAADVVVHLEPTPESGTDLATQVRILAARHGLGAHGVRVYEEGANRSLELHLEVDPGLRLEEAHRQATEVERTLHRAFPELTRIVTHLEPAGDHHHARSVPSTDVEQIQRVLKEFLDETDLAGEPHDLNVQWSGGELAVSFHCVIDPDMSITDAHELTQRLEAHLRQKVPNLGRVLIHVEPPAEANGTL